MPTIVFLGASGSLTGLHAGDESKQVQPRIWILPFSHAGEDPEKSITTGVAISEVLTVLVSRATGADVVDRDHLEQVLAEHSLSRKGLLSPEVQLKVGRLLGATVLVSGSFMEGSQDLMVTAHAAEIGSSRVISSRRVSSRPEGGRAEDLAGLLNRLQQQLVDDLRRWRPTVWSGRADESPIDSLFFLEGLNHYHAGRYNHALAEFVKASRESKLQEVSRFWMARTYLAQGDHGHAYIELRKLQLQGSPGVDVAAVARHLSSCVKHMSEEEKELHEELLERFKEKAD